MNPLLIPVGILLVSPLVYFWRRNALAASLLSILASLVMVFALWALPFLPQGQALGRTILIDDLRRWTLTFMLLGSALFFLYAWRISQGWSFFPFILFGDGLLAMAVMIESPLLSAIFLEMVGIVLVFLIPGGIEGRTRGALGFLIALGLAGPLLIGSSWLLDQAALQPDNLPLLRTTAFILALGYGVLLAALPFGFYLVGVAHDAPPLVSGFLSSIYPTAAFSIFLGLLNRYPWLGERGQVGDLLFWGGLLTAVGGGVLGFAQKTPAGLLAYGAIADMGVILAGVGVGSGEGISGSMTHIASRFLALALLTMSWGAIRYHWGMTSPQLPAGITGSLPWAALGYFLGGLALAGFPGTSGFATRWAVAGAVESHWPLGGLVLWGSGMAVAWRYFQILIQVWGHDAQAGSWRERVVPLLVITLCGAIILFGLYPQGLFPPAGEFLLVDNQ